MRVLGIMSGSSVDGLDLALCDFAEQGTAITHSVLATDGAAFPAELHDRLLNASSISAFAMAQLHADLGRAIGTAAQEFLRSHGPADLIASHGHTVFHQPTNGFTTQIGCGARIASITGLPAVVDFRTKDVALGGQGAPLVPLGERDLFPGHAAYLNLGGIANVSIHMAGNVTGTDVCICNQALNYLAHEVTLPYDADGVMARSGAVNEGLLAVLNDLAYAQRSYPFTLGREDFEERMRVLLSDRSIPLADRARTCVEHIAQAISRASAPAAGGTCMITGGGAFNGFLVERITALANVRPVLPDARTIAFKEAVIFAYLGWLRWHARPNALASVTKATRDSVGGALYLPN